MCLYFSVTNCTSSFAGVGVPILLGYIYGVVPISLCRSSGCGVTTSDSGGVHFEIEEGTNPSGTSGPYPGR